MKKLFATALTLYLLASMSFPQAQNPTKGKKDEFTAAPDKPPAPSRSGGYFERGGADIGKGFGHGAKELGKGAGRFGKAIGKGEFGVAGREMGRGAGRFGKSVGKGVGRGFKNIGKGFAGIGKRIDQFATGTDKEKRAQK